MFHSTNPPGYEKRVKAMAVIGAWKCNLTIMLVGEFFAVLGKRDLPGFQKSCAINIGIVLAMVLTKSSRYPVIRMIACG